MPTPWSRIETSLRQISEFDYMRKAISEKKKMHRTHAFSTNKGCLTHKRGSWSKENIWMFGLLWLMGKQVKLVHELFHEDGMNVTFFLYLCSLFKETFKDRGLNQSAFGLSNWHAASLLNNYNLTITILIQSSAVPLALPNGRLSWDLTWWTLLYMRNNEHQLHSQENGIFSKSAKNTADSRVQ